MDSRFRGDEVSDRETSSFGRSSDNEKRNSGDKRGDTEKKHKENNSNSFIGHEILQSKFLASVPSPSADEGGWASGVGSLSLLSNEKQNGELCIVQNDKEESVNKNKSHSKLFSFEERVIKNYNQLGYPKMSEEDDQANQVRDKWGFTGSIRTNEDNLDDEISYDDVEDGSEWLSDVDKVPTNEGIDGTTFDGGYGGGDFPQLLPRLEQFSKDESSVWPLEIPLSTENDSDLVSQNDKIAARFEINRSRGISDEKNTFDDPFQAPESAEVLRVEKQKTYDRFGSDSKEPTKASTRISSQQVFSATRYGCKPVSEETLARYSSHQKSNVTHTDFKPLEQGISISENKIVISAKSNRALNAAHDSSKFTSKDKFGFGSEVLSSSSLSSIFSSDGTRAAAQDNRESTSGNRSNSDNKVSSSSMFSSDQTPSVARDYSKLKVHDVSGSAREVSSSSSTTLSPDSSGSTAQDISGSERSELKSSPATSSSYLSTSAKIASTFTISSHVVEESSNTINDIEECPTTRQSSDVIDKLHHSFAKEKSNFGRQLSDSRFHPGRIVGVAHFPIGTSENTKVAASNSDSFAMLTNNAHWNYQSSERGNSSNLQSNRPVSKSISRRYQRSRGGRKSSKHSVTSRTKVSSIHSRDSESTEAQILRTQSNTPSLTPVYSSARRESKAKQRDRASDLNRNVMSRYSSSYRSESGDSGGLKKTRGKFENKIEASPNTKTKKTTRKPERTRKQINVANEGFQKSLSNIQLERYSGAGNTLTTSLKSKDPSANGLHFSKSMSWLNDFDCGLKTQRKRIHATINNEGYRNLVRKAYYKLLKVRPRLKYLLSLSEWLHVHMLLLYARIFDCELHFYGIALPREFQIAIPNKMTIFEPLAAVIFSIGIVEESDMGVTYIPVARSHRGSDIFKPHDKDDVTEFLEWTQYDWNSSWYRVEKARLERRTKAAEKNIKIPKSVKTFDDAKLEEWQRLVVEKWLGWDDDLWFSYNQACYVLSRIGRFVSFPSKCSKRGSYAWLLPRHTKDGGTFVRLPRPNLSPDSWMIALMLNMCALESTTTSTWYHETNAVYNVQNLINCFLGAAMTTRSVDVAISL